MLLSNVRFAALVALLIGSLALPVFAMDPTAAEHAASIKATLAKSQTVLRHYEWLETTVVSLNGEEQSRRQMRCSYDADGVVRKVPVQQSDPQVKKLASFGRKTEISKKQKEELAAVIADAEKLIHQYIPLNQNGIQAADKEGKLAYQLLETGKRGRLTIRNFLKSGDSIDLDMDLTNNRPLLLTIFSYLNFEAQPVSLTASFGTLNSTTIFTAETVLEIRRRNLTITVQNSGYRKKGQ
jgi:hypothetical protein